MKLVKISISLLTILLVSIIFSCDQAFTIKSNLDDKIIVEPDYSIQRYFAIDIYSGNVGESSLIASDYRNQIFNINNDSTNDGKKTIYWNVYLSSDRYLQEDQDELIKSGTLGPLIMKSSRMSLFDFTLPLDPGNYMLILKITSDDDYDTTNNIAYSNYFKVWKAFGNVESDDSEDDYDISKAEDYFIQLNPADSVEIDGTIDTAKGSSDLFKISTGSDSEALYINLQWEITEVNDILDLYLLNSKGVEIATSVDTLNGTTWVIDPDVTSHNNVYYVGVRRTQIELSSTLTNNYKLIIEASRAD